MFNVRNQSGLEFLSFEPWWERGIVHGFTTVAHDFSRVRRQAEAAVILKAFKCTQFACLNQVHGCAVVDLRGGRARPVEGDAIVAGRMSGNGGGESSIIGVFTADCVPIFLLAESEIAAVHAGWRGLAAGIIPRTLEHFMYRGQLEAVIGPCAGSESYEVGPEVIEALGQDAVYRKSSHSGRYILDLSATAAAQLTAGGVTAVSDSRISTITDKRFHSHRRDGARAGRGLAFALCNLSVLE